MYFVYVLKSVSHPEKIYVGFTQSIDGRINTHNLGQSSYTAKYAPWVLIGYTAFLDESRV